MPTQNINITKTHQGIIFILFIFTSSTHALKGLLIMVQFNIINKGKKTMRIKSTKKLVFNIKKNVK